MKKVLSIMVVFLCSVFTLQSNGAEVFTNSVGMKMIKIEPGSFEMGNPNAKHDSWDEQPVHKVTISQSFHISETEVTIEQFEQFRLDYLGSLRAEPYITGLSWHDAAAFCKWLSEKEGKPYRLPTEAEWEYAARGSTDTAFWSGENPPENDEANPWGLKNIHSGPSEWCQDWYGPYPYEAQLDPVGPDTGLSRVVRGGGLDRRTPYYARSCNRASQVPVFEIMRGTEPSKRPEKREFSDEPRLEGLIGLWYGRINFNDSKAVDHITTLDMDWSSFQQPGQDRASKWSAKWHGLLVSPTTGKVTFHVASDHAVSLVIDGKTIVEWDGGPAEKSGSIVLEKGKKYAIGASYVHNMGKKQFLKVLWSWEGQERTGIPTANLRHSESQREEQRKLGPKEFLPGHHFIGFRVVQAPLPASRPHRGARPFISECIVQSQPRLEQGPNLNKPWFRQRDIVPIPPDNSLQEESVAAGLFPGFMAHIHNAGLEVFPNGDVVAVYFTAAAEPHGEDMPDVSLISMRLRFGASRWDMPESFIDFGDLNDTSSLLWKEGKTIYCFWGHVFHACGYPFQWISSEDNGVTWSKVHLPQFVGEIGPRTNQPINSAIRTSDGTFYLPCDGIGGTCVLWNTKDNMKTWYDPGGRTFGRHTSCTLLKDGRILGMGGKHTNIDGYMPKSISSDGGKTWETSITPFATLGSGQRPTLLRLQSGRLFFAGDFQHRQGHYPEGIKQRGAYVALSDDEARTWHIKKLAGTMPYDGGGINEPISENPHDTIGYAVARQAQNGIIHLIASINRPNQHWELNEAWILDDSAGCMKHENNQMTDVEQFEQRYASGRIQATFSGGVTQEGEYRLHGKHLWYHENGNKQWQVTYEAGNKVGEETFWDQQGNKIWTWNHRDDGKELWTQFYSNGKKKSESTWRNFRAEGEAKRWNYRGELISHNHFIDGTLQSSKQDKTGKKKIGREFNILKYGAIEGGDVLCTEAIQKAIDACADAGGGQVVIPAGTFLSGTVFMKSNVDIHIEKDAVLLGSPWMRDYPPQKPTTRRRYDWHLRTSLIFAQGARGISVTGEGTLNGNSKGENDFMEKGGRSKYRPVFIWFDECTNVTVRDVTFTSSGFWTQAHTKCRNVHVDGITVTDSTFPNNDGCNIIDCENAVVENCDIDALDDGICLKAYTPQGCKNVVIRNNRVRSLCNGIKAGTDSSGGFENLLIENNVVYNTGISGIALEIVDGGVMRNVVVRDIMMDIVGTPIFIKLGDRHRPVYIDGAETKTSGGSISDVHISGIRAIVDKVEKRDEQERKIHNFHPYASSITGYPGSYVERVYIDDVDIEVLGGFDIRTAEDAKRQIPENSTKYPENRTFGTLPAYGFYIRHAKDIEMTNIRVAIKQQDGRPAFVLDDVHNSVFCDIRTQSVSETPTFSTLPNCTGLELDQQ